MARVHLGFSFEQIWGFRWRPLQRSDHREHRDFTADSRACNFSRDSDHRISYSTPGSLEHSDVSFGRLYGSCDRFRQNAVFLSRTVCVCYAVNVN
jgi:hypothetical protein